jgi:hypothetical protein
VTDKIPWRDNETFQAVFKEMKLPLMYFTAALLFGRHKGVYDTENTKLPGSSMYRSFYNDGIRIE